MGSTDLPEQQIDQLPWERDALILRKPDVAISDRIVMEESTASVEEQFAEAYQYLRLTISNWLNSPRDPRGPATATALSKIIHKQLPLYEKRKRCDILLEPFIREWLSVEQTEERRPLSILREDCLSLEEEACTGTCSWSGGRCLIHVPKREDATDPVRIFTARLSDELLRYSSKRVEILEQKVQAIRRTRGAVRVGDELFLTTRAKESAEAILDRLGFFDQAAIQLPEELLRFEGLDDADVPMPVESATSEKPRGLPAAWIEKGLQLATNNEDRQTSFAVGTKIPIEKWEERIRAKRKVLTLPGDPNRPVNWSLQDWYALVRILYSDILVIIQEAGGDIMIAEWIEFPIPPGTNVRHLYSVFWNGQFVIRGNVYRFPMEGLPNDLRTAMGVSKPLLEADVKNTVELSEGPPPLEKAVIQLEVQPKLQETQEVPKSEVPKPEVPKSEVTKPEVPKPEVPKSEVPKPELPKPEVPKSEVPKLEVQEIFKIKVPSAKVEDSSESKSDEGSSSESKSDEGSSSEPLPVKLADKVVQVGTAVDAAITSAVNSAVSTIKKALT